MPPIVCNIDKSDRINRAVIGVIMILGALIGLGTVFFCLLGLILVVEGIVGWCAIPHIMARFNLNKPNNQ